MSLDLYALAAEWRELAEPVDDGIAVDDASLARIDAFKALCRELGTDEEPDGLEEADADYLIADDEFEGHAQELAEDASSIDLSQWPASCIDWSQAASELQMDYTSLEFDGVTYWYR